jgi:hypothetical protein
MEYSPQQIHHPDCKTLNEYQHMTSNNNMINNSPTPFTETFFSNDGGPLMLPVNGV